jgi:hypothetical protein
MKNILEVQQRGSSKRVGHHFLNMLNYFWNDLINIYNTLYFKNVNFIILLFIKFLQPQMSLKFFIWLKNLIFSQINLLLAVPEAVFLVRLGTSSQCFSHIPRSQLGTSSFSNWLKIRPLVSLSSFFKFYFGCECNQ